ncbi:GntR family transcriptional regulator [Georgfuchsia toluolica]|uniref:GntR family transcriptional regulator n=1 Tax=Georgfuchsia toluolica TaxID=424218 RepID=A0A916N9J3_9PROT|nr:GntR family transcriptional regulator [Georgfuchsia toluolica]CAG4884035.1 GntR family transcriptional regulator [Georgfuchsia toluolica]
MNATTTRAAASGATTITRTALYEEVAERLRASIFAHELAPGSWIDEQALADQFGISRTPMREALKVLASEGLVLLKPRRGCYVAELSDADLDEVFPIMALLEGRAAYEAALKAGARDIAELEHIHADLEHHAATGDTNRFFAANDAFHTALQDIAGNRWLKQLIEDTRKVIKLTRRQSLEVGGRIHESMLEHRQVMAAIKRHEPNEAGRAMHDHLLSGRAALAQLQRPR